MPHKTNIPFEIRLEKEPLPLDHPHRLASIALQPDAHEDVIKTNLVPLRQIHPFENWYAKQLIRSSQHGKLSYVFNDDILFGHAKLDQKHIADELREIYRDLVRLLSTKHYALLRAWHYLPRLAGSSDYQLFCDARAQAFSTLKADSYCAATVIGTNSDCGIVYFIAARKAGITINNPRQTLPHLYPKHYVKPAPMFARATLKRWDNTNHLYISGTAAIVGHASLHEGDADAQLNEAICNLKTLLSEASKEEQRYSKMQLAQLQHIKLYADKRISGDINSLIDKHLGANIEFHVFEGQMCRPELLVEIEAMAVSDCTHNNDA